jgi:riboflavin kinase/FMN adenylyltransferase
MNHAAVAIGTFDGLHLGHRYLLSRLINSAREEGLKVVVVTLDAPVRPVAGLLTTIEEKVRLLGTLPVDDIVVLPITPDIIDLPAADFFEKFIVKKLRAKRLVVGNDFAFGYGREGDIRWLKRTGPAHGVSVTVVAPLRREGGVISSSRIRALIADGDVDAAKRLLGRPYSLEGVQEKGRGVGTQIGFPTINLSLPPEKLVPRGVFACLVEGQGAVFPGVVNIGTRPTFFDKGRVTVEVNLLDFNGAWKKGKDVLHLYHRLREEMRFPSVSALQKQIAKDRRDAENYFCSKVR